MLPGQFIRCHDDPMSTLQPFVPTGIAVAGRPHAAEVLVSHFAPAPAAPPAAPAPTPFTFRVMLGLIGVLLAVLVSGFNEHVIEVELDDIQGAMGFSHDQGSWVTAIYEATEISAMAFAPWCGITFSIRRFAIAMIGLFAVLGAISPYAPDLPVLYVLRAVQGFAGGTLAAVADDGRPSLPAAQDQDPWARRLYAHRDLRAQYGHAARRLVLRISRLALGILGGDPL